ncbi:NAD-glutamate dehydrogenase [Parerythrobacter jejuensis]|uniref:Glutamate dehydrogenase n=1 Tax=Parerythrobacter jejuensis TaxID=795812 RepID=A0A845AN70_9SPHN|nr:NAD-glutamate dehydrogenase domain-containing protein [Parerythrobacter jejuensis]MXP31064.1 glutamate dehydrogenase [Parerythrobacter jejuensis]MXP33824.1 glutamate dehydrogenase [Parerythrobacter jejuensis]
MSTKGDAAASKGPDPKLLNTLAKKLGAALLPGDDPISAKEIKDAARFVYAAAERRDTGEAAISMVSETEGRRFLRVAIINDDMPFLVDSVAATIAARGLSIDRLVHPVLRVERSDRGRLAGLPGKKSEAPRESMIYLETERVDAKQRRELEQTLRATLADVRAAVADWPSMQDIMARDADTVENAEGEALLRWLNDGMLTQLGHVTRHRNGSHSELLGICRKSAKQILADASYDRAFAWFDKSGKQASRIPLIVKANRLSNVHRRVPLDLFIIPRFEGKKVASLSIHAGVWTSAALAAKPGQVPQLRAQLGGLMDAHEFDPGGHAGKALVHALTTLPHDLIIGFADDDISRVTTTMMSLVDRPRPRMALVEAPLARHLFAFVWLPRDMMSTDVRRRIQAMLESATGSQLLDWSLEVEGGTLAMLRFVLDIREASGTIDEDALEDRMQDMLRGWNEAVESELSNIVETGRAAALASRFAGAFPPSYRTDYGAREAAIDIDRIRLLSKHIGDDDHAAEADARDARLYNLASDAENALRLKIYQHEGGLSLSDAVPALENFGFRVLTEIPSPLADGALGTVHDFLLAVPEGNAKAAILERAEPIERAIADVLNGHAEDDPFNRLVVGTGLAARDAELLRALYRYLRQTGMGFTIYTVVDALARAPSVTKALIALFEARHNPGFDGDRSAAEEAASASIRAGLAKVAAINDDRLLRLYKSVIDAMLRTNAFAPAAAEAMAFKIDSALIPNLPKPVPWREVFVYSRRVEGIHLRAGPVARGGLRWSDRRDDFRTEILGLMKAQRVKNAVIVPSGAKGGFYPKQLPDPGRDRDGWAAEGQASYEVFIRTLLSITDNIVEGKVVHPRDVVIRDGEDPYFVVAADKGTARFSDIANGIAESRDFWLDDAFASGGSNGYDHKAMGITAKGAWVSVQRHFLEMGIDVQKEPVRVVGCGDMSGDVFGNGMLLSKAIKLVAAFDHRHIFIDPDPDPAASWKERKRMFELPRSSWEDYNAKLISKGGGIFPRSAKSIKLSKPARDALGIDEANIEPEALISAIIKTPADLLWFGGIGTYVKAERENNIQVGDPANDTMRVDGRDLRVKVVGEGANLGVTQAGRIEFALAGGRINTDFIDNSAGVDCSDNEVNIKIALAAARRAGKLSEKKRNTLLADMTDEVSDIVLEDNRLQALALSIAEHGGPDATASHLRLIETLEEAGDLDRRTEGLADSETLTRRAGDGIGLTRPELAVLLSSTKLALQDAIEASDLPEDPALQRNLSDYFPAPMRKRYGAQIEDHRLRREIIATDLANRIVNRLGLIHPFELAEEESVGLADVATAFVAAERLFDVRELWELLDDSAMPESTRLALFDRMAVAMRIQMADVLRVCSGFTSPSAVVAELRPSIDALSTGTENLLANESRQISAKLKQEFSEAGAPEKIANQVVHMFDLDGAVGLAKLAVDASIDPRKLAASFTALGEELGLAWAQGTAALMNPSDVWERLLVAGLARDFQQMRFDFLQRLARRKGMVDNPFKVVDSWIEENRAAIRQFRSMITRAQAHTPVAPAMLAQIASQARNVLSR